MKTVIVVGAGATYSDAASNPLRRRPPLDRGFFSACGKLGMSEKTSIINYLKHYYDIDPTIDNQDSLERIMAIIYADIANPNLETHAVAAFRMLIRLFNRRVAETTNSLKPTNQTNLYRIIAKHLCCGVDPRDITIITFNQDLQRENWGRV